MIFDGSRGRNTVPLISQHLDLSPIAGSNVASHVIH